MLEDLRENVLTLLEKRVENAIEIIRGFKEEKLALESENNQLRNELDQRDVQIQNLEQRTAELNHFESELQMLRNEREQERLDVDKEKAEVRERLEGLMTMLNNVETRTDRQEAEQPSAFEDTSEPTDNEEEQPEEEQPSIPSDTLFIPMTLAEQQEAEQPSDSDDTDDETVFA